MSMHAGDKLFPPLHDRDLVDREILSVEDGTVYYRFKGHRELYWSTNNHSMQNLVAKGWTSVAPRVVVPEGL